MTRTNKQLKWVIIGFVGVGVLLIALGSWGVYRELNQVQPFTVSPVASKAVNLAAEKEVMDATTEAETMIMIDIGGAVNVPGVYKVSAQARLADAVAAAGGFSENVDQEYLNKTLNLAAPLKDSQKIYIVQSGEAVEGVKIASETASTTDGVETGISINNASQKELQTLSGIGEVRAQAIVSGRPYKSVSELVERGILTEKIFANIKEAITL